MNMLGFETTGRPFRGGFNGAAAARTVLSIAGAVALLSGCASYHEAAIEARAESLRAFQAADYSNFLRGRYAELSNDPIAAAHYYDEAALRGFGDPSVLTHAVAAHLSAADLAGALSVLARAGSATDTPTLARAARAAEALRRGDFALAAERSGQSPDLGLRIMNAFAIAATKDKARALDALGAAPGAQGAPAALFDNPTPPALATVLIAYARGFIDELAEDDANAAIDFEAAVDGPLALAVGAEGRGRALERLGRRDEAKAWYVESLARLPGHVGLVQALARVSATGAASGPRLSAAAALAQFFAADASLLEELGAKEAAGNLVGLARGLDPLAENVALTRAEFLAAQGRRLEARAELVQIGAKSPYFLAARQRAVALLREEDRSQDALSLAKSTAIAAPGYESSLLVGETLQTLERYDEAEAAFTAIIEPLGEPKPEHWVAFFQRGAARERQGKWDLAEADLRQALKLSPEQSITLNYLGYGLVERREKLDEGFDLIRRAVTLNPQSGAIIDSLGWAYFQVGDYAAALDALERAVELTPSDWEVSNHLGDVYWRLDRQLEAGFQWKRALTLNPPADKKAAIEDKLAHGLPKVGLEAGEAALETKPAAKAAKKR